MKNRLPSLLPALTLAVFATLANAQAIDPSMFNGLVWRNIGPFRGGRVAAVTGVIGQPGTFYMGMPGGGVWKTTSAGTSWFPVFDAIKEVSSIGAVEVAPSDPNIIYVGTGDMRTGGAVNEGNGVYKSTDAGKTWTNIGLPDSHQIPSIKVDPRDPNLVYVAAQGNLYEESEERGFFRSTDGGQTWKRTLFVDKRTGCERIAFAYDRPDTILAVTSRHFNAPGAAQGRGQRGQAPAAGTESGYHLFISHDKGLTWKEISGHGLPALAGRMCPAVAQNTDGKRMFLVGNFGLYRSDDGGENWRHMDAEDRRISNGQGGYNCGVYVNPQDPETVYVVNTCSYISHDGGKTFTGFKGAPGGDDPQQIWLDPKDGKRLFFGTDQGATISQDGGETWSSWYNQPTAQVYHISVDNQWPYWVYATQQDSGSIATASRGNLGAITNLDWLPHPGYEFGAVVADPLNPKVSYAGGPSGGIVKVTYPSGQYINVSPNLESGAGLRKTGNQQLAFSPRNPHELLAGFQFLMSTTDGGLHWRKLSPDLGIDPTAPKPATPATPAARPARPTGQVPEDDDELDEDDLDGLMAQQAQFGGTIDGFSASPVDGNVIWAGTTNGFVKLTRDHGKTWADVSVRGLPGGRRADVVCVDASHHDAATAFIAVDLHNLGDYNTYIYRTRDFGQHWDKVTQGIGAMPSGNFARVVRCDPVRKGLVFAGTESGVYVSFNDGDMWQSLLQNAPNTSYRDMVVKGNDLVVGTYGRSFWILDDISPLRQVAAATSGEPVHLFAPATAVRVRRNVNEDTPFPPEVPHALNPPSGAILYYSLTRPATGTVEIEVADMAGHVIRHLSSVPPEPLKEPAPPIPDFWIEKPTPLTRVAGLNRAVWDLRCDPPHAFSHSYEINANPGLTPASPLGPMVAPGRYRVTLKAEGQTLTQEVTVVNDPRSPASADDVAQQWKLQWDAYQTSAKAWETYQALTKVNDQVSALEKGDIDEATKATLEEFATKLAGIRGGPVGAGRFGGGGGGQRPAPTCSRVMGSANAFLGELDNGDIAPTQAMVRQLDSIKSDLVAVLKAWEALKAKDLVQLNTVLSKAGLKPVIAG